MCVRARLHACVHVCVCFLYLCIFVCLCVFVCVCACVRAFACVHVRGRVRACVYVCTHACINGLRRSSTMTLEKCKSKFFSVSLLRVVGVP